MKYGTMYWIPHSTCVCGSEFFSQDTIVRRSSNRRDDRRSIQDLGDIPNISSIKYNILGNATRGASIICQSTRLAKVPCVVAPDGRYEGNGGTDGDLSCAGTDGHYVGSATPDRA